MAGRIWIILGAISAAAAVASGAIGAHILKQRLEPQLLETFEVAVRYQLYHAVALVLTGLLAARSGKPGTVAGWLFVIGTLLFSGGLYAWIASGSPAFVMVVPLGGMSWIAGWLALALGQFASH